MARHATRVTRHAGRSPLETKEACASTAALRTIRHTRNKLQVREPVAPTEELRSKACDDDCISRRTSAMPSAHRCTLLTLRQICMMEIRHGVRARAQREQDSACAPKVGSSVEPEQRGTSVCGAGPLQDCFLLLPEPLLTLTKAHSCTANTSSLILARMAGKLDVEAACKVFDTAGEDSTRCSRL